MSDDASSNGGAGGEAGTEKTRPAPDTIYPSLPLDELVAALGRSALFRDVEPAQLRLLAFSAEVRDVPAETPIYEAGAHGAPAMLVSGGRLLADDEVIGPGALVNAQGAMAHTELPVTLKAKTNTRLLVIDRPLVARLISEYPTMGRAMMQSLGMDLRSLARGIRAQARDAVAKASSASART